MLQRQDRCFRLNSHHWKLQRHETPGEHMYTYSGKEKGFTRKKQKFLDIKHSEGLKCAPEKTAFLCGPKRKTTLNMQHNTIWPKKENILETFNFLLFRCWWIILWQSVLGSASWRRYSPRYCWWHNKKSAAPLRSKQWVFHFIRQHSKLWHSAIVEFFVCQLHLP